MRQMYVLCACTALFVFPASTFGAERDEPGGLKYPLLNESVKRFGEKKVDRYRQLHGWARSLNRKATGRNVVFYGMPRRGRDRLATRKEFRTTLAKLDLWRHPPPPPEPVYVAPTSAAGETSAYSGGGLPSESIIACESGGSYTAQNPSGAYGKYQIMPEHWNGGVCSDLGRDPPGQDKCASRLWDDGAGSGNWAQCGG